MKTKTCDKLTSQIMEIWETYAFSNGVNDRIINDVMENYIISLGEIYFPNNLDLTVFQMTNSHKRMLLKEMKNIAKKLII